VAITAFCRLCKRREIGFMVSNAARMNHLRYEHAVIEFDAQTWLLDAAFVTE